MFEYTNEGTIIVNIIVICLMLMVISFDKGRNGGTIFVLFIWITFNFYFIYDTNKTANNNISKFKAGYKLICHSGLNATYSVSLQDNWKLDKQYFVKNSLMIRVNKCEDK